MLDVFSNQLTSFELSVVAVRTVEESIAAISGGYRPDFMLTDIDISADSEEAKLLSHAVEWLPEVRILVVNEQSVDKLSALRHTSSHLVVLQKPLTRSDLAQALSAADIRSPHP